MTHIAGQEGAIVAVDFGDPLAEPSVQDTTAEYAGAAATASDNQKQQQQYTGSQYTEAAAPSTQPTEAELVRSFIVRPKLESCLNKSCRDSQKTWSSVCM